MTMATMTLAEDDVDDGHADGGDDTSDSGGDDDNHSDGPTPPR